MDESNPWRRSGTENIHLDTASTNSRRESHWFSWRIRRVASTTSRLVSGCREAMNDFLVHVRKLQKNRHHVEPRVKLNSPREESFPNPLKYIDLSRTTHTQTWMLSKSVASMIIGTSMGQEICLILGQVSLSLFY